MKTNDITERDFDLDALLASARGYGPVPSETLMARVMADAVAVQPQPIERPLARTTAAKMLARWLDQLAAVFGGGGALAGISLAMVAGVFIGVVQPAPVAALTSALLVETQVDLVDLFPTDAALWEE